VFSFTSARERALWAGAAVVGVTILGSILPGASVAAQLRERGLLGPTTAAFLVAIAVLVAGAAARPPARWRTWSVLVAAGAIGAAGCQRPGYLTERVHVVEYAALALLLEGALRARRGASGSFDRIPLVLALGATAFAGCIDEGLQALVPTRVGDPRDIVLDATSGALALGIAVAYRAACARDARP